MRSKVIILSRDRNSGVMEREMRSIALRILKILRVENSVLEVYFMKESEMREFNKKFRNRDKPADILSFKEPGKFPHPEDSLSHLGEIYLKIPITNYSVAQLLVHGILHLFGYNHKRKNDRMRMERTEQRLLKILNPKS